MNINFSPLNSDVPLVASVSGDVLTLNGDKFDFSPLEEGDVLPWGAIDSEWFHGPVSRINGVINLTLVSPYPGVGNKAQCFPEPLVNVSGPVDFPEPDPEPEVIEIEVPESEED